MIGIMWLRAALREPRPKCWVVENKVMEGASSGEVRKVGAESVFEYATWDANSRMLSRD
jgi:hypothetical protein